MLEKQNILDNKLFKNINKESEKKELTKRIKSNDFNFFRKKAIIKKYDTNTNYSYTEREKRNVKIKKQIENNKNNNNLEVSQLKISPKNNLVLLVASSGGLYNTSICKLIISDSNLILIQTIKKVLKNNILDISIKDKNNFATISADQFIEIWSKKNNIFKLIEMIEIKRKKNFPCFLDSFEGIIKYLKNGIIIISCFGTIKIYNNIKSMRKHELSFIIKVNSKIFNIRKNCLIFFNNFFPKKISYNNKLYEDDKNNYSIIYFYKLKKYKLIKKNKN